MIVVEGPMALRSLLERERARCKTVGLFPTTGVSHGGHTANIAKMAAECDVAVVSIFGGPSRLGCAEGTFVARPDITSDLARAEEAGATVAFVPASGEIFASDNTTMVSVGRLSRALEGQYRPGYLDSAATVAAKLLSLAGPCYAYFGEKHYQQLLVVRKMVDDLFLPVVVVACPTVREEDGLALSSSNCYLSSPERAGASAFYWALLAGKRAVDEAGEADAGKVRAIMKDAASRDLMVKLDYAEVADPETLSPLERISGLARLLVAGRIGRARFVDNLAAGEREA